MAFFQEPPRLGNQLLDDPLLCEYLTRRLSPDERRLVWEELSELGQLAGGPLYELQLADRLNEPRLTQWSPWGQRVDEIEVTPLWKQAARLAAQFGVVGAAYEPALGPLSRVNQFTRAYLFNPSSDVYSCPLAMTDGAARTLLEIAPPALIERAVPRLTSRDPAEMWTSGQWMTERTGGSDVGHTETIARRDAAGRFRLYGTKWFTSATTAQMALTLARPQGEGEGKGGPGGRGLALFYVEVRDESGRYNGLSVNRLKDKLGTRKVPTAELTLDGTLAEPVAGLTDGVRNISTMLNVTRTWNAAMSAGGMRRAVALCRDYARRRVAFGAPLAEKPLHLDTLAGLEAELEGAFLLAFRAVELLGRWEHRVASKDELLLMRLLTPLAKLTTGKQAVAVASEALECFGGAGYVEDTGLPMLLRDAQVLPIWEGTTNVLSIDTLKVLLGSGDPVQAVGVLTAEAEAQLAGVRSEALRPCAEAARRALAHAASWLAVTPPPAIEAGARRLALTLGRALELSLLTGHAAWCIETQSAGAARAVAAARRLCRHGVDLLNGGLSSGLADETLVALGDTPPTLTESRILAMAEAVPQS